MRPALMTCLSNSRVIDTIAIRSKAIFKQLPILFAGPKQFLMFFSINLRLPNPRIDNLFGQIFDSSHRDFFVAWRRGS